MKPKKQFFGMRHGESFATVKRIIVSNPQEGVHEDYGLTVVGEWQVRRSIMRAKKLGLLGRKPLIWSSPLSRCAETAQIAREILRVKEEVQFDIRLGERWFGELDGTGIENYRRVWRLDRRDSNHKMFGVESSQEVQARMWEVVMDCERDFAGETFLLVSHGDPLQILVAAFLGMPPSIHRNLPEFTLAEIREFVLPQA